jgi:hypothetical protein
MKSAKSSNSASLALLQTDSSRYHQLFGMNTSKNVSGKLCQRCQRKWSWNFRINSNDIFIAAPIALTRRVGFAAGDFFASVYSATRWCRCFRFSSIAMALHFDN